MNKKFIAASLAALGAFAGHAQAQTDLKAEKQLRFFVGMGATFGGDNLATARYTNGTTANIRAGGVVQFHAGANYKFTDKISGSLAAGYHFNRANGTNGSITFSRFPIEVLGQYAVTPTVRLGGGLRLISGAKLSSSGAASGIQADFSSTVGAVVEGEYLMSDRFGLKLRYVNEHYKLNGVQNKVDGSHAGVMFNYYF
jgi:hypothetical protein